ncbi:MAG: ribonuclease P protein component [Campylobacterota bacterium]|nr:ribonuclease P protein component [Campylobacterota bacterium]
MLKQHSEFGRVYNRGKSAHSRSCVVFYLPCNGEKKIGYTASKKVGNAVIRNRSKRRMRALWKELQNKLLDGHYVFVAKSALHKTPYLTLQKDVNYVLKKLNAKIIFT